MEYIFKKITKPYYLSGKKYYCPVCEHYARSFRTLRIFTMFWRYFNIHLSIWKRKNSLCPRCDSRERHRSLWLYLKTNSDFLLNSNNYNKKMLHIAPEKCFTKIFSKQPNIDYLSADLDSSKAMIKMDIQKIPFPEQFFDLILCNHVLEHVPDDRKAMREFYRVLKKGGMAIITVPINYNSEKTFEDTRIITQEQRIKYYGQENHLRYYGLDFKERLEKQNFIVKCEKYTDKIDEELKEYCCLPKKQYIYLGSKE